LKPRNWISLMQNYRAADQVAEGMKRGKIAFTWKQLARLAGSAVPPMPSAHDG